MEIRTPLPGSSIAVFDFDHTLIEGDSFWTFLGLAVGWPRTLLALADALVRLGLKRLKDKDDPAAIDPRTFVKGYLLTHLLAGRSVEQLTPDIRRLQHRLHWKESIRKALLEHYAEGHHIVIASGGLDLYLPELLSDVPHHGLICTEIEVRDGKITGIMANGNCVRQRKAELVAIYLAQHGPFPDSWGYGNLPHDLPMLDLVKHRIVV